MVGLVTTPVMPIHLNRSRPKYGARRCQLDGYTFDSQAEARRYGELLYAARAGVITDLQVHPRYALTLNGIHLCDYVADFTYTLPSGTRIVEDVKSPPTRTPLYRLKRKLFETLHHLPIVEVNTSTIRG